VAAVGSGFLRRVSEPGRTAGTVLLG
jgi:hypothetical protein